MVQASAAVSRGTLNLSSTLACATVCYGDSVAVNKKEAEIGMRLRLKSGGFVGRSRLNKISWKVHIPA